MRRRRCPACHRISVTLDESEVHVCPDHGRFSERIWQEFNAGRRASRLLRSVDALIEIRAEQALTDIMAMAQWHRWCLTRCNPIPGYRPLGYQRPELFGRYINH